MEVKYLVAIDQAQVERRKLMYILEDIVRKCDLDALAVVTQKDAEEIAFFTEMDTNSDIFCTLAAATLDTATKVTNKLNHGAVTELVVIGDRGYTIMSPIGENFILIGAGRDFFSMGKTILIMREKVQYIPSSLIPKNSISSKRKACSHFCQNDGLYCCICAKRIDICELCKTSVQGIQATKKNRRQRENLSNKKQIEQENVNPTQHLNQTEEDLKSQSDELLGKIQRKLDEKSTALSSEKEKEDFSKQKTTKSKKKGKKTSKSRKKQTQSKSGKKKPKKSRKRRKR